MISAAGCGIVRRPSGFPITAALARRKDQNTIMADDQTAERRLLDRIAAGETEALRSLYLIHSSRLYAHAFRISGNPASAEDIVQESLLAVWRDAGRFRGEGKVLAWLLGIVHHKAVTAVRGRRIFSLEREAGVLLSTAPPPEETALGNERKALLKAGLDRLSPKHRLVLDLIFFQGLSLAEAAAVCGCPVGTIKSRLNQAKSGLRGILDKAESWENI